MGAAISASLATWQVCHGCNVARMATIICGPYCFLHSLRSQCTTRPGEAKSSPERGSFVAFQRTNRTNGRPANDHRAYEDPLTHNLKVTGSNPIPATTFVISSSASRSNRRDGCFLGKSDPADKSSATALILGRKLCELRITSSNPSCSARMAGGAGSPGEFGGGKAQYWRAFFISVPDRQIGRGVDFSPKRRFFSEPLDCADSVRF